jgi:hypothetical protein
MKKFISTVSTTLVALLFTANANAGLLNIDFSADDIKVGESVSVTITAQDFEAADAFYFDFNFDGLMLAFDDTSLSSDLMLVDEDMGIFDGLTAEVFPFGLAFDFFDFMTVDGDFMVASFDLIATAEGMSDFSVSGFERDYAPSDYNVTFTGADSVNVSSSVAVSEPSAAFMMMLAGFALVSSRRKAK